MSRMTGRSWAYVGAGLAGTVSVGANVSHSFVPPAGAPATWAPHAGAVIGSVFWPLAVVVSLEIMTRIDWPEGWRWIALRWLGLAPVSVGAAIVSYRHMSGLLTFYGEDVITATIGPLVVDGLMVLASGALLVAPSARRAARRRPAPAPVQAPVQASVAAPPPVPAPSVPAPADRPVVAAPEAAAGVPADLHAVGRQVAAELAEKDVPLTRKALVTGLRERGIPVGTTRATELLAELKAAA
ncbi:MAG: hypothetical protein JNL54_03415 [Kineosporiaceae bacterium]|nr:hypothetical protein [Kineosporiaceae bacterium]